MTYYYLKNWQNIDIPFRLIQLSIDDQERLAQLDIDPINFPQSDSSTQLSQSINLALSDYFRGKLIQFDITLAPAATEFQQRFRQALLAIPFGTTKTYGELAKQLNSSPRAIGAACRANRIPIIVPCHRVVAANGIGGYAGETEGELITRKRWLLDHETYSLK